MKLPTQKKLLIEDFKNAPEWVRPMIDVLNSFMESVYQALNKNITFRENIASFIKEISYKTSAAYPAEEDIEFMNELKTKATGVEVLQAYEKTTYTPAPGPVYAPWVEDNGTIRVSAITGLEASKTYLIRLLVS